jgi:peptidoglycan hydrolase-like protein with peptidoglycan-binding domain
MGSVDGMIAAARSLLGLKESPPGSNHNKVTEWYGVNTAWCDIAICYEAYHSDNSGAVYGKHAWTVEHAKTFRSHGRWHYGLGGIRRGDVVFFDWGGSRDIDRIDHVGLVEAVHSNGTITTLEGNTSDMFARRTRNSSTVVGYGRPAYGSGSAPMPPDDGMLRRGSRGNNVKTLQTNLNTVMHSGLTVDGDFGPATEAAVKAFQRKYGLEVDGVYGPKSAAMMAAALKGGTTPIPPKPRPPVGPLKVDGDFGPATTAAMQRSLNKHHNAGLTVDGGFGPKTKRALQSALKVAADGNVGPITIRALQKHVGAKVDGNWGPDTTRHLQTALNADTF